MKRIGTYEDIKTEAAKTVALNNLAKQLNCNVEDIDYCDLTFVLFDLRTFKVVAF